MAHSSSLDSGALLHPLLSFERVVSKCPVPEQSFWTQARQLDVPRAAYNVMLAYSAAVVGTDWAHYVAGTSLTQTAMV